MKSVFLILAVLFSLLCSPLLGQNFSLDNPDNILSRRNKVAIENAITYKTAFFYRIFNNTVDFSEITFTIIPNHFAYMLYQSQIGISPVRQSAGFFVPSRRELVVCKDKRFRDTFLKTTFHELSHAFLHLHADGKYIPAWLDEGLAGYLENMTFSSRRIRHRTNRFMIARVRTLIELQEVNLAEFVNWSYERFARESFSQAGFGYAIAYCMVLFLMQQQNEARTFTIFRNLIGGKSTIDVFNRYYEGGFAQFERDFMAHFSQSGIR